MDKMKNGDKIINLVPVIISKSKSKRCQCDDPRYEIDPVNREVRCLECGNYIDPIDALMDLAHRWDSIKQWEDRQKEVVRALARYKPWKKAMKDIEFHIGKKGKMIPVCPHCHRGFHLEDINGYVSPDICQNDGWKESK